jgi:hypothetical protein
MKMRSCDQLRENRASRAAVLFDRAGQTADPPGLIKEGR